MPDLTADERMLQTRLLLVCDAARSLFFLAKEGENSREYFTELKAALDRAADTVADDTLVTVCNESGNLLVEIAVAPRQGR